MTRPIELGDILRQLAYRYHHYKQENKQKGPVSSRNRRHTRDMRELEQAFDKAVERWLPDPAARDAWREHFYHFGPVPPDPQLAPPPAFRGRDETGRTMELTPAPDGGYTLVVGGKPVRSVAASVQLGDQRIHAVRAEGAAFAEVFEAPDAAKDALTAYIDSPDIGTPWEHLSDLYSDGVVDENFGLTARGRRLIAARREGTGPGVDLSLG
jgi:hypothetical protein